MSRRWLPRAGIFVFVIRSVEIELRLLITNY